MNTIGTLREKTYKFFTKSYKDKNEFKKALKTFKNIMTEHKELASVYNLYSQFDTHHIDNNVISDEFISEAVFEIESLMNESFTKGFKKWEKLIGDVKIDGINIINESLDKLIYLKGPKTLLEQVKAKMALQDVLKQNKNNIIEENQKPVSPSLLGTVLAQKFNDMFKDMNESERDLFKQINSLSQDEVKKEINSLKENISNKLSDFQEDEKLKPLLDEVNIKLNETTNDRLSLYKLRMLNEDLTD